MNQLLQNHDSTDWWKRSTVYQIYPRSFQDSNSDGIGDLRGIISRLDYLAELGIDLIWLGPICKSPNADMGYDVSDYTDIMDEFGTMADFEDLLAEARNRGIGLIVDLVVNHSSDEHAWFRDARHSHEGRCRDFYIWRTSKDGPPNNWLSIFGGPAWSYDNAAEAYYLHLFANRQPDLNWDNPELRQEVYAIMRYWLDKGVAGFRLDVVSFFSKPLGLPSAPEPTEDWLAWYANGPNIHAYLQEMHEQVLASYEAVTIGEAPGVTPEEAVEYVEPERRELDMVFLFDLMQIDRHPAHFEQKVEWSARKFRQVFSHWNDALGETGWNSVFFGNHDFPRMVSRFGCSGAHREVSAKMLATLQFTLRGTPFVYNGDEIGMTDVRFESIDEYRDVATINAYSAALDAGLGPVDALDRVAATSRDNARTPMQWTAESNAGFTDSDDAWISLNPNFDKINVAAAEADPESVLFYYRRLIKLRKKHDVLVTGNLEFQHTGQDDIIGYTRALDDEVVCVLLNISVNTHLLPPQNWYPTGNSEPMIGNYPTIEVCPKQMRPYEAIVVIVRQ